jgi:hypothetical protein
MTNLAPDQPTLEDPAAELLARGRAFVERAEKNPWVHALRRAKAEAESVGSDAPIAAFLRKFYAARKAGDPWLT